MATKYWQQQNIGCNKEYWHLQNIGADKMLAPTKYSRRQNTRVDKILTLTKYSPQQNVGVNKILSSTKSSRQQKSYVNKILVSTKCWRMRRSISLLFGRAESTATDSPRPCWFSAVSPRRCWSLHMQSPSVPLPLAALLLRAEYWGRQNIGTQQDFTNFRQTIAVCISAHRCPIKN